MSTEHVYFYIIWVFFFSISALSTERIVHEKRKQHEPLACQWWTKWNRRLETNNTHHVYMYRMQTIYVSISTLQLLRFCRVVVTNIQTACDCASQKIASLVCVLRHWQSVHANCRFRFSIPASHLSVTLSLFDRCTLIFVQFYFTSNCSVHTANPSKKKAKNDSTTIVFIRSNIGFVFKLFFLFVDNRDKLQVSIMMGNAVFIVLFIMSCTYQVSIVSG